MSFQHASFLYALPLAVLPVLIHLFASKMQRRAPFPWIKLLVGAQYEGKRRRKLLEVLILILRTLAIASLIFLAAGPYRGELFKFKYIAVDNSPSARYDSLAVSKLVKKIKKEMHSIEIFYILDRLYSRPSNYDVAANFDILRKLRGKGIIVSDFQASNVGSYRDSTSGVVKVPPPDDVLKILAVKVEPGITMKGFEAHLKVFLRAKEKKAVRLNLYFNEKLITGGNFEVTSDSINVLTLKFIPTHGGVWKAEILPFDDLPEDNIRYFPLTVLEKLRVGIVGNNRFIAKALNPFKIKNYPLKVTNGLTGDGELSKFDIIFLTDMKISYPALMNLLRYTENGGKLVIFSDKIPDAILNVLGISGKPLNSSTVIIERDTLKFTSAMKFSGGKPLMHNIAGNSIVVFKKFAAGKCVLVGLPSDINTSLFPISPTFVPFLYSLIEKLFNARSQMMIVEAGTPCMKLLSGKEVVKTPQGQNIPCSQLKFKKIGLYRDSLEIGVNLPEVESEGRFLSLKELKKRFGEVYSYKNFEKLVDGSKSYSEIFKYFLLFYLIIESILLGWKFRQ